MEWICALKDEGKLKGFSFRARVGEFEVELSGTREEVAKAIKDLPSLMGDVSKAFEVLKPKTTTTLTIKTAPSAGGGKEEVPVQKYPKIAGAEGAGDEAVLRLLETDWGKWRPRTIDELRGALEANGLHFPGSALAGALLGLVRSGRVRRWKTDAGVVYILAEQEISAVKEGESK